MGWEQYSFEKPWNSQLYYPLWSFQSIAWGILILNTKYCIGYCYPEKYYLFHWNSSWSGFPGFLFVKYGNATLHDYAWSQGHKSFKGLWIWAAVQFYNFIKNMAGFLSGALISQSHSLTWAKSLQNRYHDFWIPVWEEMLYCAIYPSNRVSGAFLKHIYINYLLTFQHSVRWNTSEMWLS